jgi:hypothetical protein
LHGSLHFLASGVDYEPPVRLKQRPYTKQAGAWRKIATSLGKGVPAKVTVFAGMIVNGFRIDLEPFRKHIAKGQYGRVLFKSGEEVLVGFDYLIEPSDDRLRSKASD